MLTLRSREALTNDKYSLRWNFIRFVSKTIYHKCNVYHNTELKQTGINKHSKNTKHDVRNVEQEQRIK